MRSYNTLSCLPPVQASRRDRAMPRLCCVFVFVLCVATAASAGEPIKVGPGDWPWWRGPNRNGVADPGQKPPLKWSKTENVLWQASVPGRGHGSPIVVGD